MALRTVCADLLRVMYVDREPCSSFPPLAQSLIWRSRAPPDSRVNRLIVDPWMALPAHMRPEVGFQRFMQFALDFLGAIGSVSDRGAPAEDTTVFQLSLVKSLQMLLSFGILGRAVQVGTIKPVLKSPMVSALETSIS